MRSAGTRSGARGGPRNWTWLSHHRDEQLERCTVVAGVAICRRCLALWPATYALFALQLLLRAPARHPLDPGLAALLLPALLDYLGVHAGSTPYRPVRVWAFSLLAAPGLARLLYRFSADPLDPLSGPVLLLGGSLALWAALQARPHDELPGLDELPPELQEALQRAPREAPPPGGAHHSASSQAPLSKES